MTTISHNRRRKNSPLLPFLLGAIGLSLVAGIIFWRDGIASVLWRVGEPVLNTGGAAGGFLTSVASPFFSKAGLVSENDRLRQALAAATTALIDRDMLYRENLELKARLGRTATSSGAILAGILLRPPGTPYDTLILDAGKNDGVQVGNLVSPGGTIVIGAIDEAYDTTSRVRLFSSPQEKHEGFIAGTIPVTVKGLGGGAMVAEVPVGEPVAVGSDVTFSGSASQFVAQVTWVETKEGSSFATVHLSLPANLLSLRFVEVLPHTVLYEQE